MSIINNVSKYLSISIKDIETFAKKAPLTYRTYNIPKKNGKFRTIHHPAKETKALQYALIKLVFENYKIHISALAYKKGFRSPLKVNAEQHSKYLFSIKIDFRDFFHSILFTDLENILATPYSREEKEFLKNCLFLKYQGAYCLAIGSPSSPILSNIIMYEYDKKITHLVNTIDLEGKYTRYADDITFSSNHKEHCTSFKEELTKLTKKVDSPKLSVNSSKTILLTKANRKIITGLVITPEGNVSIGRANKKHIKKLLNDVKYNKITHDNFKYLKGYLSFIRDVEPQFINSVTNKYGAELLIRIINN